MPGIEDILTKQELANFIQQTLDRLNLAKGAVLKLVKGGQGAVSYETQLVTYPGGTANATAVVDHGLSGAPVVIQLSRDDTGPLIDDLFYSNVTATQFTINTHATSIPAAGQQNVVGWTAFL